MSQRSKYAARPITNGSSGQVAQAATVEFKRVEQALNDRLYPSAGMDGTYNAAAFPMQTAAATLTKAIAQAKANGVTRVWSPQSLLDDLVASDVTYDSSVHLFREGGSASDTDYEPEAYGAKLNGTTDDWTALTACTTGHAATGGIVRHGPGHLYLARPWVVTTDLRYIGPAVAGQADASGSQFSYLSCPTGPTLITCFSNTFGPLGDPIVSGSTSAFGTGSVIPIETYSMDLRDARAAELNGLAAFCYECYFTTSDVGNNYFIAGSVGTDYAGTGHTAFYVRTTSAGALLGSLRIAGSTYTVTGGSLSTATVYWAALTYDGSTVRLYYGEPGGTSSLAGSTAASGTLDQDPREIVVPFGSDPAKIYNGLPGYWGPCRISDTARYTATGTVPSTIFSYDNHSLVILNLDTFDGILTKGIVTHGIQSDYWFFVRRTTNVGSRHHIENLGINGATYGMGIVNGSGQGSVFRNIYVANAHDGYISQGSNWSVTIDRIYTKGITRYCLGIFGEAMHRIFEPHFTIASGRWGLSTTTSVELYGGYMVTGQGSTIGTVSCIDVESGSQVTVHGTSLSSENTSAFCEAIVRVAGDFRMFGGTLETKAGIPYLYTYSSGSNVRCDGVTFSKISDALTSVMKCREALAIPAPFTNCHQNVWVPWADRAGAATVGHLGKGAAITFSATPSFDCSLRDEFEITLTGNCAPTVTNVTPGQPIKVTIKQDGTGGWTFTWPANVKGGGAPSGTASSVSQQCFTADLSSASAPVFYPDGPMMVV